MSDMPYWFLKLHPARQTALLETMQIDSLNVPRLDTVNPTVELLVRIIEVLESK